MVVVVTVAVCCTAVGVVVVTVSARLRPSMRGGRGFASGYRNVGVVVDRGPERQALRHQHCPLALPDGVIVIVVVARVQTSRA